MEVKGDAVWDGDAGVRMRPSGARTTGPAARDAGLVAVAEQSGEPVVGEADGGGLHEQEVFGGGGLGGGGERGGGLLVGSGGDGGDAGGGDAGGGERGGGGVEGVGGRGKHDVPGGVGLRRATRRRLARVRSWW